MQFSRHNKIVARIGLSYILGTFDQKDNKTMALFKIEYNSCDKDGFCALDCPAKIIEMKEEEGPVLMKGGEEFCIQCGHCVAICPQMFKF